MKKITILEMSESITIGLCLAFSGGLMDAYSYIGRGGVFANAQTGNIILFIINLAELNINCLNYLLPILSFVIGVAFSATMRVLLKYNDRFLHWRQITVLAEILILASVAFIGKDYNVVANSLISLACGAQVESFRKVKGVGLATTMCIGNLRTGTQLVVEAIHTKSYKTLLDGLLSFLVIIVFALGALTGYFVLKYWDTFTILISSAVLVIVFILMFIKPLENKYPEKEEKTI